MSDTLKAVGGYFVIVWGISLFLVACSMKHEDSDGDDGPPPPVRCEGFLEVEPNADFLQAQFITILPQYHPDPICGEYVGIWEDIDSYWFWLQPQDMLPQTIPLNVVFDTDKEITPYISFYQSEYDQMGVPTGSYMWLGTFFGEGGRIEILDFPVPYVWGEKRDLFLIVEHITPLPSGDAAYELAFWN